MAGDRSRAGSRVAVNQGRSAARSRGRRQGESDGSVQQDRPDAATSATGTARVTASASRRRRGPVRWCTLRRGIGSGGDITVAHSFLLRAPQRRGEGSFAPGAAIDVPFLATTDGLTDAVEPGQSVL
jgi:hypothetical protein